MEKRIVYAIFLELIKITQKYHVTFDVFDGDLVVKDEHGDTARLPLSDINYPQEPYGSEG